MKSKWIVTSLVLTAAFVLATRQAVSDDKKPAAPDDAAMKAMMEGMQKWLASIKPGAAHEKLEPNVGTWDVTFRMWMDPSAPPMETKGTTTVKWILDKRFLLEEYKGEMLMPDETGGMKKVPYEGMGTLGYDNYRNMYTGTWMSNLQTNILTMTGSFDQSGKVLRMFGEMDEPMLNITGRMVKYMTTYKDNDTRVFECFDLHPSDTYKVFEIVYKRKK